ncbi:NAD(P)/FAD-dependent oxidoreductase [Aerosakkonema funiforme]|uniref:NAD(P)/FAD-dependent oxidoreductase n=2 Tax=Oscillatoriophycideae TaxID=1301283 RepID=UPI002AC87F70|nr:NAD(P)/FAD-dependent oxidoreductase [Aerosakkonema funiforme]
MTGNSKISETNVVIIGSGPSGAAAAILLAKMGWRVVIVERETFPRDRPGETLHPGIEPLLEQLGVAAQILSADFLRHEGNWVKWSSESTFVPFGADERGKWRGFQAWRSHFDAILQNQAIELGVEIRQPCRALHPVVRENRIVGVETSDGFLPSSFIIDAAGSGHWLAKQLTLPIQTYSPRLIAYYGYASGDCPIRDDAPAIVADKSGWTWTARVRPQLYQWTRLFFANETIEKNWLPEEFQGLIPKGKIGAADVTWRVVPACAGLGYFIVGDAAAVLDPASSHGVLKAIMSGMMAAHLIIQMVNKGAIELQAIQAYRQWLNNWFGQDLAKLRELYGTLPHPPDWI